MAQTIGRLTAVRVAKHKEPGYLADGANLYFRVAPGGGRGWIFRFGLAGRTRDMGLGAYPEISLAAARDLAEKFRRLVKEGVDPIEHRRADRASQRIAAAKNLTFDECARAYVEDHEAQSSASTSDTVPSAQVSEKRRAIPQKPAKHGWGAGHGERTEYQFTAGWTVAAGASSSPAS